MRTRNRNANFVETLLKNLTDEFWFGDGKPKWKQGPTLRPCKSSAVALKEQMAAVKCIKKYGESESIAEIAARLTGCRPGERCLSGACPECSRALQRMMVAKLRPEMRSLMKFSSYETVCQLTIVPRALQIDATSPDIYGHCAQLIPCISEALTISDVETVVGGFDIAFNEHQDGAFEPYWQPHAHLIVLKSEIDGGIAALRGMFDRGAGIHAPVHVQNFDGSSLGFAYNWKSDFRRRVTLTASEGGRARRSSMRDLRPHQKLILWSALDRMGLGGRVIIRGLD
jgi:hypothetical protein